jgi:hypothetical protein
MPVVCCDVIQQLGVSDSLLILCGWQGLWQWGKPDLLFPRFFVLMQ